MATLLLQLHTTTPTTTTTTILPCVCWLFAVIVIVAFEIQLLSCPKTLRRGNNCNCTWKWDRIVSESCVQVLQHVPCSNGPNKRQFEYQHVRCAKSKAKIPRPKRMNWLSMPSFVMSVWHSELKFCQMIYAWDVGIDASMPQSQPFFKSVNCFAVAVAVALCVWATLLVYADVAFITFYPQCCQLIFRPRLWPRQERSFDPFY